MKEYLYPDGVNELRDSALRELVKSLSREIGQEFELWIRIADFGRKISVGILNSQRAAVILEVARSGRVRSEVNDQILNRIRSHLRSTSNEDLSLTLG